MMHHPSNHKPRHRNNSPRPWDEDDEEELINGHGHAGGTISPRPLPGIIPHWTPQPLPPPQARQDLAKFGALERSAEVFRYSLLSLEHWLSPGGALREWMKFNLSLALLIAIPAMLVAPLVSLALAQISAWVAHLTETTSKLVLFPLTALLIVGLVCALVYLARAFPLVMWKQQGRYTRHPQSHPYYED